MKPFIFNEQEYTDLNSLGLAFIEQYDMALQVITEKPFLKFFKKFKTYKKIIRTIFYQSKYLQSALSMIIYQITEEHILYIGHQRYESLMDCLNNLTSNPAMIYFVEDHGFTHTILSSIQDEKIIADVKALEDNPKDKLAIEIMEGYDQKDSVEHLPEEITNLMSLKDPFKESFQIFSKPSIQKALAYKYSLKEVMEIRKKECPVFFSILLVKDVIENAFSIVETAFYHSLIENLKNYKFKKKEGKNFRVKIKQLKKKFKKYTKLSAMDQILLEEQLYLLYLDWVTLYHMGRVIIKEEALKPEIPYCNTYISTHLQEEHQYEVDEMENTEDHPLTCQYDLNRCCKSLKTHRNFAIWSIVISILSMLLFTVFVFDNSLRVQILKLINSVLFTFDYPEKGISQEDPWFFAVGSAALAVAVLVAIFILSIRLVDKKKYKGLCKLTYYRRNVDILNEEEILEFEELKKNESRYAKQIDRFYRFYGGVGMAGLSLGVVLVTLGLLYSFSSIFQAGMADKIYSLLDTRFYFIFGAPILCLLLSFARHKKTAWSVIFTLFISMAVAVGIVYIPM